MRPVEYLGLPCLSKYNTSFLDFDRMLRERDHERRRVSVHAAARQGGDGHTSGDGGPPPPPRTARGAGPRVRNTLMLLLLD